MRVSWIEAIIEEVVYFGLLRGSLSGPMYGAAFAWPSNAGALIVGIADATCRP